LVATCRKGLDADYGDKWMERHQGLLEAQCEFLVVTSLLALEGAESPIR
jgi:hypothetical protein